MKIKKQTRKLAASCSKLCFEVVDKTDEVSDHTYGKATLTWFEEIFEEYNYSDLHTIREAVSHNWRHASRYYKMDWSDFWILIEYKTS